MNCRIVVVALALIVAPSISAQGLAKTSRPDTAGVEARRIEGQLNGLHDMVAEVRRDQLNYQIERDLLKEAYGSSIQTINVVLTIILGAFAILGYIGLKNLGLLKKDFEGDLEKFRAAKSDLDSQMKVVEMAQEQAHSQVAKLEAKNEEQDRRLRTLELREKVTALITQGNFSLALDYLAIGLDMMPDDVVLMYLRAYCFGRLGRLEEAIASHEAALKLKIDPKPIVDLAELYLLANRLSDYERLLANHREVFDTRSPVLIWYFEALKLLVTGKAAAFPAHLARLLTLVTKDISVKLPGFEFQDARRALLPQKLVGTDTFFRILSFLEGKADFDSILPAPVANAAKA